MVNKGARQLSLYTGDELSATYRVGLGPHPNGDKAQQGDGATPEGKYRVCVKNPHSRYYLSLGINYPSARDAARARAGKRISAAEAQAIAEAEEASTCPPWTTSLGGEIFIHGRGSARDWTLGCIALDDRDMRQVYDAAQVGTAVEIWP